MAGYWSNGGSPKSEKCLQSSDCVLYSFEFQFGRKKRIAGYEKVRLPFGRDVLYRFDTFRRRAAAARHQLFGAAQVVRG
jgi:hypothetical protein